MPKCSQVSAALNYRGTIKTFNFHLYQTDCWAPDSGPFRVVQTDLRRRASTSARGAQSRRVLLGKQRVNQRLVAGTVLNEAAPRIAAKHRAILTG